MARKKIPGDAPDWVRDEPKKRISANRTAEEIAALEGKTSEEMGEEFQGTMEEYERYLICREQALMELPADATVDEIEDTISDLIHDYALGDDPVRASLKLENTREPRKCQHRWAERVHRMAQ